MEPSAAAYQQVRTSLGDLLVIASDLGICRVLLNGEDPGAALEAAADRFGGEPVRSQARIAAAARELRAYANGRLRRFTVTVDLSACSDFDRRVLDETARIPFGSVATYGEIAGRIGSPGAARAVGGALHRNPVPVIVPCHRVVAADGSLGGYGGGLDLKRRLLDIESRG